jgi:hypothetical protein
MSADAAAVCRAFTVTSLVPCPEARAALAVVPPAASPPDDRHPRRVPGDVVPDPDMPRCQQCGNEAMHEIPHAITARRVSRAARVTSHEQ